MKVFRNSLMIWVLSIILIGQGYAVIGENKDGKSLTMSGQVKSPEGEIIPFANILVLGTVKGAFTNLDGTFEIYDLEDGEYTIKVSAVGYKSFTRTIQVKKGTVHELDLVFEERGVEMPQVTIIASKDRVFSRVPGSVTYLDAKEIQAVNPLSGNEVLRRSPGVHVVDEEGLGMRVNIGIRGLDPDRSRSVLVLEDGIPVALAPYGEPEMYYTPVMDRMSGVEILKGSGQILFGPQTIGGVINYITANPPQEEEGSIYVQGGQGGLFSALMNYGNTFGNTGIQASLLRKRADNIGPTEFDITDFNTKFLFNLNEKSELGMKLGIYNESSNATYIGINQVMFDRGSSEDFVRLAPDDRLDVRRYSLSFSHKYRFNKNVRLNTIAYGYTTTRNWSRQDFNVNNANTPPSNWTGVVWGDVEIPGGAIFMRNSTGNRDRQFEVAGIEPRLEVDYKVLDLKNELIIGARYLYERAFEQRVNGTRAGVKSGDLVEDEVRTGYALAAYIQNKINVSSNLDLNAGLRFENFDYERDIRRRSFPGVGVRDTVLVSGNEINTLIPGIGFNYRPMQTLNVFGGIHKGYAPPRTKDAITSLGDVLDLEAEQSVNYELGLRAEPVKWLFLEATSFVMNFSNQIIPVSESSGGIGFGLVNGGATLNRGVETALVMDLSHLFGFNKTRLVYDVNATFLRATFSEDRFQNDVNIKGNRTPYAPDWFINSALTFETSSGLGLRLVGNFIGKQFSDELNTIEPSADGRIGIIPAYKVFDAMVFYRIQKWNSRFNLSIKNLTDERYISSRRPQGIRVGIPRLITVGYQFTF
ncbi:TonB-dependent receptor [Cecembia calidifontis]|uniref:Fe(3+) dicitrate transport protein n=1 Tax=Cecembia calidifontis TaxID=1187080 RepID=A0A4Q7P963_9BACT|nr:TonB-dependent receptor [Cecembia calidifontis]RZS96736.1 Fe(3+) dicitrate transport protein [Cecembia calidifontis]